ncbi:chitin synthase-domain-containing protein, partial [Blastocladiella britannica]
PLRYGSLGQSRKRTNLARIYSGFCTAEDGASVPYIVVVKIGHPWERSASAPGNRGKRDSTHLVARYLHNVLTYPGLNPRTVLSPLEAAIHDALTGANVDPRRIEFLVNVDGDTSIARRAPGVLLDILNTNRDVAAASGSMTITNSFASPWAPVAALRSAIDQHARPASQQTFSRLAIINTAFAAYRVQNP